MPHNDATGQLFQSTTQKVLTPLKVWTRFQVFLSKDVPCLDPLTEGGGECCSGDWLVRCLHPTWHVGIIHEYTFVDAQEHHLLRCTRDACAQVDCVQGASCKLPQPAQLAAQGSHVARELVPKHCLSTSFSVDTLRARPALLLSACGTVSGDPVTPINLFIHIV